MQIGYFLASEEYSPRALIEQAQQAEQAGFHALWISDHYHPWNDEQGHSGFVWSVIGALAQATSLPVTTGRIGDGFATTAPDKDAIDLYRSEGGTGPVHAGTKVCYGPDAEEALETVHRLWPNEALPGELAQVLPTPAHFEQACELITPEHISSPVGPDLDTHYESLKAYEDAGVDELFVQQIGPDQDRFFSEWAPEILKRFEHT